MSCGYQNRLAFNCNHVIYISLCIYSPKILPTSNIPRLFLFFLVGCVLPSLLYKKVMNTNLSIHYEVSREFVWWVRALLMTVTKLFSRNIYINKYVCSTGTQINCSKPTFISVNGNLWPGDATQVTCADTTNISFAISNTFEFTGFAMATDAGLQPIDHAGHRCFLDCQRLPHGKADFACWQTCPVCCQTN